MKILHQNGENIVEIDDNREVLRCLFKSCFINNLIIGEQLKVIEKEAMMGNFLKNVDLKNVIAIGESAFENNEIEGTLVIPKSVIYIGSRAFANNKIEKIIVKNPKTLIEKDAFDENCLEDKKIYSLTRI